jgi:NAD(P)-dependent dehydrogenase (short-subunit alcohol dehydrogenase family)
MNRKVVVITGCSRGLGRAMAQIFSQQGWNVAGCARDQRALTSLRTSLGTPHFFRPCDVANELAISSFTAEVLERLGPPDLLLNNAAIINPNNPLWEIGPDEFSAIVDINIKGPAALMRHFLPHMMRRGSGVIVNFSSGWGRSTAAEVAPYCATKWAMEGLSQAVAQETDGKVAVVALNPGIIDTDMLRSTFGGGASHYPNAEQWAEKAVPYLIQLGPQHNGKALTAPA